MPHDGGFLLSGSWSFASGIKHGTHIHTLGIIEGTGEPRIFVLPVEKVTLIDNWNVMGLRATGSIDYTIDSVYVPDSYTHFAVTDVPKRGGSLYTVGIVGFAAMCHSGWACGIGRRLLDELAANVRTRGGRTGTQATSESFLEQYAKAEGTYRAARALVYEVWGEMSQLLERGERPERPPAVAGSSGDGPRDVGVARRRDVRLHVGGHDRPARGNDSAPVQGHARGHAAPHRVAAGVSRARPRARGPGAEGELAVRGSGRSCRSPEGPGHVLDRTLTARPAGPQLYSQRNTFADIAVQTTNVSTSAATSVPCASHDSPFQIPSSSDTA